VFAEVFAPRKVSVAVVAVAPESLLARLVAHLEVEPAKKKARQKLAPTVRRKSGRATKVSHFFFYPPRQTAVQLLCSLTIAPDSLLPCLLLKNAEE